MKRIRWSIGLVRLARSVSPRGITTEANLPHGMLVLATDEGVGRRVMEALAGDEAAELETRGELVLRSAVKPGPAPAVELAVLAIDRPLGNGGRGDTLARAIGDARTLVVVFPSTGGLMDWGAQLSALPPTVHVELLPVLSAAPGELRRDLVPLLLRMAPDLRLTLARHFEPFRRMVARQVIFETSAGNARFAAFSNLPTLIPVIGNLLAAGADLYVLTRNQIEMVFILGAISGRDLGGGLRLLTEVAPLVGTGFLWRTVAREIVDLLPDYLGAVPKIVIAYVGTFVLGQSVAYYFIRGRRPEPEMVQQYYSTAMDQVKSFIGRLPTGGPRQ